jgi:putrescine aminotransferase
MSRGVVVPMKHASAPHKKPRQRRPAPKKKDVPPRSGMTRAQLIAESKRWLSIINAHKLNDYKRRKIVTDTLDNFRLYYNKGYLEYRKSVTQGGEFAAIEWSGTRLALRGHHRPQVHRLPRRATASIPPGINHPKIVRAVKSQLERMPLSSQELLDPLRGALAELLGELAPGDLQDCFFINNGTDAIEGAMKLARLYTGKPGFISCVRGFHGKSYGSLSLMGKGEFRLAFEPCCRTSTSCPSATPTRSRPSCGRPRRSAWRSPASWRSRCRARRAPSCRPTTTGRGLREICTRYGVLLIADEVQTGMGRTGRMFAVEHWDVVPDIVCLGKALGGGVMPLSAFMSTPEIWKVLEPNPFIHSSTFGGNPLACAPASPAST